MQSRFCSFRRTKCSSGRVISFFPHIASKLVLGKRGMTKGITALVFISLILLSLIAIQSAYAPRFAIYIRADGTIEGTNSIQRNGDVFTFLGNIAGGLYVERDSIIIDGSGYTLNGADGRGIVLSQRNNVTAKNMHITLDGGEIFELTNATNCIITANTLDGVQTSSSPTGAPLAPAPFKWLGPEGISLLNAKNNTIEKNNLTNCYSGVSLDWSNGNVVTGNNITDSVVGIEFLNGTGNFLRNNRMSNSSFSVRTYTLYSYENDVDSSNTIDGRPIIYWINATDKMVPSNAAYVVLVSSTNMTVQNANPKGILLASTTNSTISKVSIIGGGNGIDIMHSSNNNLVDSEIRNVAIGISLDSSSNNVIKRNTITGCSTRGINFAGSSNNLVTENNIIDNGYAIGPFQDSVSTSNTFSKNNFTENQYALTISGGNIISDNEFTENDNAIMGMGGSNTITSNTFRNNGIAIYTAGSGNVLQNNRMENNTKSLIIGGLISSDYGYSNTVNVLSNDVDTSNTVDGKPVIYWINQHDKTVPPNAACVILVTCTNIVVQNLNASANGQGIVLVNTSGSTVKNNTITGNDYGIGIFGSTQNTFSENYVAKNGVGMRIGDSTGNTILNNSFIANSGFAIILTGTQRDNILHHNNFINNNQAPWLPISIDKFNGPGWGNSWDDGKEGNYWSDYTTRYSTAQETSASGVWNTPYEINENNIDHHPLTKPVGNPIIPNTSTPSPEPTSTSETPSTLQPTNNTPLPTASPTIATSLPETTASAPQSGFLGTTVPNKYGYGIVAASAVTIAILCAYLAIRRRTSKT